MRRPACPRHQEHPCKLPRPRLQGLDAFNAVSRAAVGVATSLDTHIEQLMGQHGWADGGGGRGADHAGTGAGHGTRRAGVESALLGGGSTEASLFELPGFDAGEWSGCRACAVAPTLRCVSLQWQAASAAADR